MDLALSEERMAGYQAFANKIWNASRFVLMNLKEGRPEVRESELTLADRWIRSRLAAVTADLTASLEQYKFYEAADLLYHFIWHEFCDWYIELAKAGLRQGNRTTEAVLADGLDRILRLLHPFMPFITEEIWQHLPGAGKSIVVAPYPAPEAGWADGAAEWAMALFQAVVVEIRTLRTENRIAPREKLRLTVKSAGREETAALEAQTASIRSLASLSSIEFAAALPGGESVLKGVAGPFELGLVLERPADLGPERERLQKEIAKVEAEAARIAGKLENADFVAKAPAAVVAENRSRVAELRDRLEKLRRNLAKLSDPA
jgi:valyl-tRNA synthetase